MAWPSVLKRTVGCVGCANSDAEIVSSACGTGVAGAVAVGGRVSTTKPRHAAQLGVDTGGRGGPQAQPAQRAAGQGGCVPGCVCWRVRRRRGGGEEEEKEEEEEDGGTFRDLWPAGINPRQHLVQHNGRISGRREASRGPLAAVVPGAHSQVDVRPRLFGHVNADGHEPGACAPPTVVVRAAAACACATAQRSHSPALARSVRQGCNQQPLCPPAAFVAGRRGGAKPLR